MSVVFPLRVKTHDAKYNLGIFEIYYEIHFKAAKHTAPNFIIAITEKFL